MKKRKNTIIILSILLLSIGALVFSCLNAFNIVRFFKTAITLSIKNNEYTYNDEALETLNYEVKSGSLVNGDEIYFIFNEEIKDVGTYDRNSFTYNIYDKNHNNVTSSYDIIEEFENIIINKREITIETKSKSFYKTTDNKLESVSVLSGSLCNGHYIRTSGFETFSNDGMYKNTGSVNIYNKDNEDVSKNYKINYKYGIVYVYGNNDEIIDGGGSNDKETLDEQDEDGSANGTVDFENGGEPEVILRYKPSSNNQGNLMFASPTLYGNYNKNKFELAKKYSNNNGIETYGFIQELLKQSGNYKVLNGELEYLGVPSRQYDYVESYPVFQNKQNNDTYFIESNLKDKTIKTQFLDFDYYKDHALIDNISFSNSKYASEESKYYSFVCDQYLGVDYSTRNGVISFCDKYNIWQSNSIFEIAQKLMTAYKNDFVYSLNGVTSLAADNPILDFLNNTKVGRCQNFAEAAVVIFRVFGYPARPIIGYAISGANVANKSVYATTNEKHERAQVYVKGKGWVTFEFTVAPQYEEGGGNIAEKEEEDYSEYDFVVKGKDYEITYDGKEHEFEDYEILKQTKGDFHFWVDYQNRSRFVQAGSYKNRFVCRVQKYVNGQWLFINNQYKILSIDGEIQINKKNLKISDWGHHGQQFGTLSKTINVSMDHNLLNDLVDGDVIKSFRILNYDEMKSPGTYNAMVVPEVIYNTILGIDVTSSYEFQPYKLTLILT